jgi:endonuclease/exonuclease/phosphatase (EEP) superfamily protein YafD
LSGRHHRVPGTGIGSPAVRIVTTTLAAAALLFAAVAMAFRYQPVTSIPRLVLSVGATFVPLIALVGLVAAVLARRPILMIIGAVLVTATLAIQVAWYYVGNNRHPDMGPYAGPYAEVRVLSSNLRYGRADPDEFVGMASRSADVITVSELTPEAVDRYVAAGISTDFPYSVLKAHPGAGGIGLWSRYPLTPLTAIRHRAVTIPAGRVEVPGVRHKPVVASVHIMSPVSGDKNTVNEWSAGMAGAKAQLDNFAREAGPGAVIIGGDYNSTPDMRQFRDLLTNGYSDVVQQLGSGFAPTFKADHPLPPLITIDHILTRNAAAATIETVTITGSDHRSLLATVRVPLDPAA